MANPGRDMAFKALMVDVDGVVVVPRTGGWAVDMETDLGLSITTLQARFFTPHWDDVANGRAALHDRLAPVLADIAPHLNSRTLTDYWFAKDAQLDLTLLADLAALRATGVPLHLATVQEHERAAYLWDTLRLRERFDGLHHSAAVGCGKPDPAYFAAVEARTGFAPADLVLIDDKAANVEAARAAGWGGALWDGTRRLADVLSGPAVSASPPSP
ncbi:MAG: HAD-IA family hydrolase [Phenylobacterium sp.]|nr:HAD-IA family hydrolase [Phenylobacterium sp.]